MQQPQARPTLGDYDAPARELLAQLKGNVAPRSAQQQAQQYIQQQPAVNNQRNLADIEEQLGRVNSAALSKMTKPAVQSYDYDAISRFAGPSYTEGPNANIQDDTRARALAWLAAQNQQ